MYLDRIKRWRASAEYYSISRWYTDNTEEIVVYCLGFLIQLAIFSPPYYYCIITIIINIIIIIIIH